MTATRLRSCVWFFSVAVLISVPMGNGSTVSAQSSPPAPSSQPLPAFPPRPTSPQALEMPEGVPVPVERPGKRNPSEMNALSRTFQGESDAETLLPEGFRALIKQTDRIIKGSALDPESNFLPEPTGARKQIESQARDEAQSARQRWWAAELLLKTARLLDKIEPTSENQQQLVNQMRQEAVRLLAESTFRHETD